MRYVMSVYYQNGEKSGWGKEKIKIMPCRSCLSWNKCVRVGGTEDIDGRCV